MGETNMDIYRVLSGKDGRSQIDRRSFISRALAMGVALPAASLLYANRAAAEPRRGGTVRMATAHGSTTDNLDPAQWLNDFVYGISFASNNYLTEVTPDGSLKGEVIEEWESNPTADEWVFRLRDGIYFHDGRRLRAADVVASINHHLDEKNGSAARPLISGITEMIADGDVAVKFRLKSGNADFPYIFVHWLLPIKPAIENGIDWQSGVGSGGYVLKHFEPGVSAHLERFDGYWKKDRAWFDAIDMLAVADPAARASALSSGQVDLISRPETRMLDRLAAIPGLVVDEVAGGSLHGFPMKVNAPPFDNNDVRLALKYAIDRQELVDKILLGRGAVGNDNPIGPSYRFAATAEELPQRSYDPDRAKFHLKKAGLDKLAVTMHPSNAAFDGAIDAALLYSAKAKAAGIEITVQREPNDGYWSNVWNVKPWSSVYWRAQPTEDLLFSTMLDKDATWNETSFNNDRFQELLLAARAELNSELRREMYVEMQQIVSNEGGSLIPMFNNFTWARSEKVAHDPQVSNQNDLDGLRWTERWWMTE